MSADNQYRHGRDGGASDLVHITGDFTFDGSGTPLVLNVSNLGYKPQATDEFVLFSWDGGDSGWEGNWTVNLPTGWSDANGTDPNVIYPYNNTLVLTGIIPEPSALTLVGFGLLGVLMLGRARRQE